MQRIRFFAAAVMLCLTAAAAIVAQPKMFPLSSFKDEKPGETDASDPLSAFPEKGLPEAAVIGANPSFKAGAEAARRIMKFEDDALPLLIAALQKGGFYIMDERDKVLYSPASGPGLDIGFFDFEVAGMLRGLGFGLGSSLDKLARGYSGDGSQMSPADVSRLMLTDIRAMRNSKDPHIQFNAGMLFEMSRLVPENGDLAAAAPSAIKLNMIQASLIERLLLLDLLTKFENLGGDSARVFRKPSFATGELNFVNASWKRPTVGLCDAITDISSFKKTVKTGKKVVDTVKTFGELTKDINTLDKIKNSQVVKGASVVNAAMAWAKVVMAFLNLVATFELEQPMPLIRTKQSGNRVGETRNVKIKVVMNFNHSEFINCIGAAVGNHTDISVSVPKGGPMAGVTVSWEVMLSGKGYERFTSVPTFVDAANRGDISRQTTDANGENTIKLTGKPQPTDLSNQPVVPLPKRVSLNAKIALEKMDASKDIPKIVKLGLGTAIDPLAVLEVVADLVTKIPIKAYNVKVPVRDWQPCTADWGGEITYKRELRTTIVVKGTRTSNGNSTGDGFRQIYENDNAVIALNPRTREEIEAKADRKPASFYVHGKRSDVFTGKREADPCCGPVEGKYNVSFRSGKETTYSEVFSHPSDVNYRAGQRDFSLTLGLSTPMFKAMQREFLEIDETNCPIDRESAFEDYKEGVLALSDRLEDGRYGERYFDETGEILVGSKTVTGPDKSTITWSWQLARCGK